MNGTQIISRYVVIFLMFFLSIGKTEAQLACGQSIDLNTWSKEGLLTNGDWTVNAAGSSVTQSVNSLATWFVSPDDYINVMIEGKIKVNTAGDDDLVGFVFGYQDPFGALVAPASTYMNTYILDWKQATQNYQGGLSNEGFALYEVDGNFDFTTSFYQDFWQRTSNPLITVLNTNYANNGWNDFQEYTFALKYTSDSIVIWIDNVKIFEESGCFEPGRFGFYNFSQSDVIYSDFSYQYDYDFSPVDPTICLNDMALFEIGSGCPTYYPPSMTFDWDFGDGFFGSGIDPSHLYVDTGIYNVQLIATDQYGCADTSYNTINAAMIPVADAGSDDTSCVYTHQLNALPSVGLGTWTGPAGVVFGNLNSPNSTVTVPTDGLYTFTWTEENYGTCQSDDNVTILFNEFIIQSTSTDLPCYGEVNGEISVIHISGLAPYTYQWDSNAGNQTTQTATNLGAGNYEVIVNGVVCSDTLLITLTEPTVLDINAISEATVCIDEDIILSANATGGTPAYTYLWDNGLGTGQSQTVSPQAFTLYIITVTDDNGCSATDSVLIDVLPIPFVDFVTSTVEVCQTPAEAITFYNLSIPPGGQILWDLGDGTFANGDTVVHTYASFGLYSITLNVTDINGCNNSLTLDDYITVFEPPTAAFAPNPSQASASDPTFHFFDASYDDVIGWNWDIGGNNSSTLQNPKYTFPSTPGEYTIGLQVVDNHGCTDSTYRIISILENIGVYAPNTFTPDGDEFNQQWQISLNGLDVYNFELVLYNRWGELIWKSRDVTTSWDGTYNGKIVPSGTYLWMIDVKAIDNDQRYQFNGHVNVLR